MFVEVKAETGHITVTPHSSTEMGFLDQFESQIQGRLNSFVGREINDEMIARIKHDIHTCLDEALHCGRINRTYGIHVEDLNLSYPLIPKVPKINKVDELLEGLRFKVKEFTLWQ